MDASLVLVGAFGIVLMALDALLWGVTGYVVFRLCGGRREHWVVGAVLVASVFFLWNEVVTTAVMSVIGISLENESVSAVLGDALGTIDVFDVVISFGSAFAGFKVGQVLVEKITVLQPTPEF